MLQRGQQFFFNHRSSIIFSYLWSIMIGFTVDTLIYTGASSGPKKARQRYLKTLKYLIKWHDEGEVFDAASSAASAIKEVRLMHNAVRKMIMDNRKVIGE